MLLLMLGVAAAYLLGSMPTAYIFGKVLKKIDIRDHGSGNVGATNIFRTVGKVPGIIVLLIDCAKGFLAVTIIPVWLENFSTGITQDNPNTIYLVGAAVIAGHIWTVFLGFKGGKGVATTAGVLAGLAPWILLLCLAVFIAIVRIWKYVSLASITAALVLPVSAVIFQKDLFFIIFCAILSMIAVYGHRSNIRRLIRGEEKKIV